MRQRGRGILIMREFTDELEFGRHADGRFMVRLAKKLVAGPTTTTDSMPACLGLDYGLRRIGIAAGDTGRRLAFAVGTHAEGEDGSVLRVLGDLVAEREAGGHRGRPAPDRRRPRGGHGRTGPAFRRPPAAGVRRVDVDHVGRALLERRGGPLAGGRQRDRPGDRDALAAEIILQSWLDSLPAGDPGAAA